MPWDPRWVIIFFVKREGLMCVRLVVICDGCLFPIHHACSRWQATFGDRKRHVVESKESNQILIHNPLGRLGQKRCQNLGFSSIILRKIILLFENNDTSSRLTNYSATLNFDIYVIVFESDTILYSIDSKRYKSTKDSSYPRTHLRISTNQS